MKKCVLLLVILIIFIGFTSCKEEKVGKRIIGTWTRSVNSEELTLTFTKEGALSVASPNYNTNGTFSFEDGIELNVTTVDSYDMGYYLVSIDKNVLNIENDLDSCYVRHEVLVGSYDKK